VRHGGRYPASRDVLSRKPSAERFPHYRDLLLRLNRTLQALEGYDLHQFKSASITAGLQLERQIAGRWPSSADASQAPFRRKRVGLSAGDLVGGVAGELQHVQVTNPIVNSPGATSKLSSWTGLSMVGHPSCNTISRVRRSRR